MIDNVQIFESIDVGLIVLDRDLNVSGWNRWMELHSGVSARDIVSTPILHKFPNLDEPKYRRLFRSVLSFGSYACFSQKLHQYLIPLDNPHSSVEQMPFMQQSCTATPLRDAHGVITGMFICIHDVTEYAVYEQKLLQMTRIDALTHMYNRSFLDKRLSEELDRAHRFGNHFSIILLDIDHFKGINDSRGHLCGDHTLRCMATILQRLVRSMDIVGRYGGEEFLCILPETSLVNARVLAERIRMEVATEIFTWGKDVFGITVSLGVAEHGEGVLTLETLVGSADAALYRAKREGRNRVVCAESSVEHSASETVREGA